MRVGIVVAEMPHHWEHAHALCSGLGANGIEAVLHREGIQPTEDTVACWGWRLGERLRKAGKDVLVMERGYLGNRMEWTSVGWNGLNGRATFPKAFDVARYSDHFPTLLRPWNPSGDHALLIGQVNGDMSIAGMDFAAWAAVMVRQMRQAFGLPVKFRPHPVAIEHGQPRNVDGAETVYGNIYDNLSTARVVVTFNSSAAVESLLAGKPTVALDPGSIAWPIAAHTLYVQEEPNREAWLGHLAWCQWRIDEIRSGKFWPYLRDSRKPH